MDLDAMLAEAAPARHVPLDGPDSPAAVSLYRQITAQQPAAGPARHRRRITLAALTGVAIAAASATAALVIIIPGSPGRVPGLTPHSKTPAAAVLAEAAQAAARRPTAASTGPGRYVYVEAIEGQWNGGVASQPDTVGICVQTVQVWAAPDGAGREVASAPKGPCSDGLIPSQTFKKGQEIDLIVYPRAADLPRELPALEQFIVQHFEDGHADAVATFDFAGTFLQSGAAPRVRAELYRMIEKLPGLESLGPMTDKLGRHGIGVGLTADGSRYVLIFDPATSAVLEEEVVTLDASQALGPPGTASPAVGEVSGYTVYEASGVVNSLTAVPSAASSPPTPGA
jgi:hypothetical protein